MNRGKNSYCIAILFLLFSLSYSVSLASAYCVVIVAIHW